MVSIAGTSGYKFLLLGIAYGNGKATLANVTRTDTLQEEMKYREGIRIINMLRLFCFSRSKTYLAPSGLLTVFIKQDLGNLGEL
jgi:hypothetical protein